MEHVTFFEVAMTLLLTLGLSSFITLSAVLIGGLLVFKTKREAFEPFLGGKAQTESAINLDEADYSSHPAQEELPPEDPVRETFKKFDQENIRFLKQMVAESKKEEENEQQEV